MSRQVSVGEVRSRLNERSEIALLDVREEGAFAQAHPLFAASLPLGRLELEAWDRLPGRSVPIVLYDDGEGIAPLAADKLASLGYSDLALLRGGLAAWRQSGAELFRDVNVPSKAFGELVETRRHTPSIAAEELQAKLQAGEDVVVLDARSFEEYRTMSIPTAISVPGGELVLRVREIAPDPRTLVVVNCAGRTRSIIGAQSLVNAAVPNRVAALRNGTIGWTLAGFALDRGESRRFGEVGTETAQQAAAAARELAGRAGARSIDRATLEQWERDGQRTLYRFDVRTPEEYSAGHLSGFRSAPGGQLVQETDVFAPVRGARIVVVDEGGARAPMTASWLAQMGWDVAVLAGGVGRDSLLSGPWVSSRPPLPRFSSIEPSALQRLIDTGRVTVIDLTSSPDYARGHVPGAWFALRSQLQNTLSALTPPHAVVLTSADGALAVYAATDFEALAGVRPWVLEGGTAAWTAAGLPLETGATRILAVGSDVYKRPYEGTDNPQSAMQAYLDWEYGLVAQLERDATHHFRVI